MSYELEFIGVGDKVKQDADAICVRWKVPLGNNGEYIYKIAVYDTGFEPHGEEMTDHMNKYYFDDPDGKKKASDKDIDFVIVSHPHQDHAEGAKLILENFNVKALVMNRPWLYTDELMKSVKDQRITKESLAAYLREKYSIIAELEKIAIQKKIPIVEAFQGKILADKIVVCSPSKQMYLDLLIKSDDKFIDNSIAENVLIKFLKKTKNYVYSLAESWDIETLGENAETDVENETSIVIRGLSDGHGFMLCGDAGVKALTESMNYFESIGEDIRETISFFEIPHHGSRHNVTPSVLDRLLGEKVSKGTTPKGIAYASVAKGSDHPLRVVTNAYKRRGVRVFKTTGGTLRYSHGNMPERNWGTASEVEFYDKVEEE